MKKEIIENGDEKEFYISIKDKPMGFVVYNSESYKLSEIDFINLIKICLIEARNKSIGKKLIAIYRDSTDDRIEMTNSRLKLIGIENEKEPESTKRPRIK